MEKEAQPWTLASLAAALDGELLGPSDLLIRRPVSAGDDDADGITFAESEAYLTKVENSTVGAVLIGPGMSSSKPAIRVEVPRLAFFKLLHMSIRAWKGEEGIHPTAIVHPSAHLDPGASIGAYAVVGRDARVGAGAVVHPHAVIGDRCVVGDNSIMYPHAVLYPGVELGARCVVHSGAVIGADGFGFIWDGSQRLKVPQVGGVRIGDDVEVGANTCVDRATAGDTVIGRGSKLDNLIQVGHNVKIGEHVVVAGQCGISGSVTIGDRAVLGGGVGTTDHISIAADVTLGGRSGVDRDITEPGEYFGTPARPAREALRTFMTYTKLPEIWSRLRKLEKRMGVEE